MTGETIRAWTLGCLPGEGAHCKRERLGLEIFCPSNYSMYMSSEPSNEEKMVVIAALAEKFIPAPAQAAEPAKKLVQHTKNFFINKRQAYLARLAAARSGREASMAQITVGDITQTRRAWALQCKMPPDVLRKRLQRGWDMHRALTTPWGATPERSHPRIDKKATILSAKNRPCADCNKLPHLWAMEFDHRPGTVKSFSISDGESRPMAAIIAEIAKCDVVCANCHRIRTFARRGE